MGTITVSKILHCLNLMVTFTALVFLMTSMCTHQWGYNDQLTIPHPVLGAVKVKANYGLWYLCILDVCDPIKKDRTSLTADEDSRRGNTTRGLMLLTIWMVYNSLVVMIVGFFVRHKAHKNILISNLIFNVLALATGLAALSNHTDYQGTTVRWPNYGYSYKLGWAGSAVPLISIILTCVQIRFVKSEERS